MSLHSRLQFLLCSRSLATDTHFNITNAELKSASVLLRFRGRRNNGTRDDPDHQDTLQIFAFIGWQKLKPRMSVFVICREPNARSYLGDYDEILHSSSCLAEAEDEQALFPPELIVVPESSRRFIFRLSLKLCANIIMASKDWSTSWTVARISYDDVSPTPNVIRPLRAMRQFNFWPLPKNAQGSGLSSDPLDNVVLDDEDFELGAEVDQELDNEIAHMMAQRVVREDRVITTILPQPGAPQGASGLG